MGTQKRISKIEYRILSPKEIRKMSACEIIWPLTYDDDGYPIPQGLMDLKLGVIDYGLYCETCHQKMGECPGHFGHLELNLPVIHVGYAKIIHRLLKLTCCNCGRLLPNRLINEHSQNYNKNNQKISEIFQNNLFRNLFYWTCNKCYKPLLKNNINELDKLSDALDLIENKKATEATYKILRQFNLFSGARCKYCKEEQPKRKFIKPNVFIEIEFKGGGFYERRIPFDDIFERIKKIDIEDLKILEVSTKEITEVYGMLKAFSLNCDGDECICGFCGSKQSNIEFEQPSTFYKSDYSRSRKLNKLTPIDIQTQLKKITNSDLKLLGYDPDVFRPEWLILNVIPIPPVAIRPSIIYKNGSRAEDDLTHKLVEIIRINRRIQESINNGAPLFVIEELWELLQYHINTYFNNSIPNYPSGEHSDGRQLKTITERLSEHLQEAFNWKFQDSYAYSVISPNPNISLCEIGIPDVIAKKLIIPGSINSHNIKKIQEFIEISKLSNHSDNFYPIVSVIRDDGKKIIINDNNRERIAKLVKIGWGFERELINGDIIILTQKQPFYQSSFLAYKIRKLDTLTFQLNPVICQSMHIQYGKQLKIYIPKSDEARTEAAVLLTLQENLISPRNGKSIIGVESDIITGIFLLTHGRHFLSKDQVLFLLNFSDIQHMPPPLKIENGESIWDNKWIFSQILPDNLNMTYKSSLCKKCQICREEYCPYDAFVKIVNGNLHFGTIDRIALGLFEGCIINQIIHDLGIETAIQFTENCVKLSIRFLMINGFSLDLDNWNLPEEIKLKIFQLMKFNQNILNKTNNFENYENQEKMNENIYNHTYLEICNVIRENDYYSSASWIMALLSSSGTISEFMQISSNVDLRLDNFNKTQTDAFSGRILPHIKKGKTDFSYFSFTKENYRKGLSAPTFFLDAIRGRTETLRKENAIDDLIKLRQRVNQSLHNLKVHEDGTVRTLGGTIVQFLYGEDGIDPRNNNSWDNNKIKKIVDCHLLQKDNLSNDRLL